MNHYDVAIVGGGPAGTTAGTLLKKYNPNLQVLILEKEKFPRDHVGESQLPQISSILEEMGCWEEVEAAQFPIKIGATYRWGRAGDLWDFDFMRKINGAGIVDYLNTILIKKPGFFSNEETRFPLPISPTWKKESAPLPLLDVFLKLTAIVENLITV